MKKLLLTIAVAFAAFSVQAQKISYANLMKMAKSKDEAALVKTLKKWKYKHGKTYETQGLTINDWGWGNIVFDAEGNDFSAGDKWAIVSFSQNERGLKQVEYVFDLNDNYDQVKVSLKPLEFPKKGIFAKIKKKIEKAGWTLESQSETPDGQIRLIYAKKGVKDRIELRRQDMGMLRYSWR